MFRLLNVIWTFLNRSQILEQSFTWIPSEKLATFGGLSEVGTIYLMEGVVVTSDTSTVSDRDTPCGNPLHLWPKDPIMSAEDSNEPKSE